MKNPNIIIPKKKQQVEKNADTGERVSMDVEEEEAVVDDKKRKYTEVKIMKKGGTNKHAIKKDTTRTPLQ
jgi:hypothetical protein